uniref:Uncharacterized protein n=1 Tax=Branchiostoma floridae TaxID=7739 RepID=C3YUQ2_BRAFL|eukprot:XP_002599941.1 hypothetical protein BRAFLDRAFT_74066 [Branchiostoma floridae]
MTSSGWTEHRYLYVNLTGTPADQFCAKQPTNVLQFTTGNQAREKMRGSLTLLVLLVALVVTLDDVDAHALRCDCAPSCDCRRVDRDTSHAAAEREQRDLAGDVLQVHDNAEDERAENMVVYRDDVNKEDGEIIQTAMEFLA